MPCGETKVDEVKESHTQKVDNEYILNLPRPLTIEEKKYLLAVERGDMANVRRILQVAHKSENKSIDINCVDNFGRGALSLAIESENLEMVKLLVVMGVDTKDAVLHSINHDFIDAVEILLDYEEMLHTNEVKENGRNTIHSWQKVEPASARYPAEMTPVMLAAHQNNYEILKLLFDRGATLPSPHDIRCGCEECLRLATEDSLRFSRTRVNQYKALSSPSLILLSSSDPLMTAFELSWELKELSISEPESRHEYRKLKKQVERFAVDLLQQVRSTSELSTILNHDPNTESNEHDKQLATLQIAIDYKQKEFVAHAHVQQLLATIWYEGVPGFRRMSNFKRGWILLKTALLFPLYCLIYIVAPTSKTGKLLCRPFVKFLVHASSYLFFLLILTLVSQRAENEVVKLLSSDEMIRNTDRIKQRGVAPSPLEYMILIYVCGFIVEEIQEVYVKGLRSYLHNLWNFIDFIRNFLYITTIILRAIAYFQQKKEIEYNSSAAYIPRENWNDFDFQLIAEGLFAAANIFSALKIVHLFSINPYLGPLQISLGRMVIDIVKFFFIYTLVLFAFASGLNQLLWYFADLEKQKCYIHVTEPDWDSSSDSCIKWRRFSNLFESCQSLFWASFGGVGIDSFELTGIKSYTRFWGLLMFGSYSVINVIVLLNLLIAMMSNSYSIIEDHADTEWKFARSKLWMNYFQKGGMLPPPFNILPPFNLVCECCKFHNKSDAQQSDARSYVQEHKYNSVMRALIWRYVVNIYAENETKSIVDDVVEEIKSDMSSWRCELLNVLKRNSMDIDGVNVKEKGRKLKQWERRLVKDFQIAGPVDELGNDNQDSSLQVQQTSTDLNPKWKAMKRLSRLTSAKHCWREVTNESTSYSTISLQNQAIWKQAIEEAQTLITNNPLPPVTPIHLPNAAVAFSIVHVLRDDKESQTHSQPVTPKRFISKSVGRLSPNDCNDLSKNAQNSFHTLDSLLSPRKITDRIVNDDGNTDISKPKPRFPSPKHVPEIIIIPTTPKSEHRKNNLRKLVKIEPRSPRFCTRSPRKGWL